MAMGVIQFAIGVFGNVPCPIVFGAAVDAACRARDVMCGMLGACASYDNDSFRHLYLGQSQFMLANNGFVPKLETFHGDVKRPTD